MPQPKKERKKNIRKQQQQQHLKKLCQSTHTHSQAHSPLANTHSPGLDMGLKAMTCNIFTQGWGSSGHRISFLPLASSTDYCARDQKQEPRGGGDNSKSPSWRSSMTQIRERRGIKSVSEPTEATAPIFLLRLSP